MCLARYTWTLQWHLSVTGLRRCRQRVGYYRDERMRMMMLMMMMMMMMVVVMMMMMMMLMMMMAAMIGIM